MTINRILIKRVESRSGGAAIGLGLFLLVSLATRLALLIKSSHVVDFDLSLLGALVCGSLFDTATALLFMAPVALFLACLPARFFEARWGRALAHGGVYLFLAVLIFGAAAEFLFWDEFNARFNFIAVDYLIYTQEVVGNIRESYPMPLIFGGIFLGAALLHFAVWKTGLLQRWMKSSVEPMRARWLGAGAWVAAAVAVTLAVNSNELPAFANNYHRELGKNGVWSLFAAFRNNELDYDQFYSTLPIEEAFKKIREEITQDGSRTFGTNTFDTLRMNNNTGAPLRMNVIQITVESLSASFLGCFNPKSKLTPRLDELAQRSLVFDNFYATGTRTDRGMEALTLSIPPTPGRSLVKRPNNENLFTLGSIFKNHGYDTAFIYGGYGYFDNMNYFFGHNGYRIVDRTSVKKDDITFANAWGACDEDLFRWTLREADQAYSKGTPFFHFLMTTSNHRPYTFPDGRIDLPSKVSGRNGVVKYTDYAIGKFIQDAASHPWYSNTVFVIVADHCASVAGKVELPVQNYHIPMLIYTPGGQIQPGHIKDLASQIDYPPTLLGLLNWSYAERFFGWDVRKATGDRRALIGNYQRLGLYEPEHITVLKPQQIADEYIFDPITFQQKHLTSNLSDVGETIAYYQTASYLFRHKLYRALTPDENDSVKLALKK